MRLLQSDDQNSVEAPQGLSVGDIEKENAASEALKACLEAEGLTGAVQLKSKPQWQCIHCKQEFPLHLLSDLQEHESECARKTAAAANRAHLNPTQDWLNKTAFRSQEESYQSNYQMGEMPEKRKIKTLPTRIGACCRVQ
mmetsp:Transcript_6373/g.8634  ORF Transcript_6373/g.8634 Transcript_6373/m.8634 type:complete len:140 (-) Transcript_6373:145-564(-)